MAVVSRGPAFTWAWQDAGLLMGGPEGQWWEGIIWGWAAVGTTGDCTPGAAWLCCPRPHLLQCAPWLIPARSRLGAEYEQSLCWACAGRQGLRVSPVPISINPPAPCLCPHRRAGPFSSSRCGASVPIPVPTQVQNYQRIEQNLQSPTQFHTPRCVRGPWDPPPPPAFGQPCAGRHCCPLGHCNSVPPSTRRTSRDFRLGQLPGGCL